MKAQKALETLSHLIADAYPQIVLCPLDEEQALLLQAGKQSTADFFLVCRQVFGTNMNSAFQKVCIRVVDDCERLYDAFHASPAMQDHTALIRSASEQFAAIQLLAQYAPVDSLYEKAALSNYALCAGSCYRDLQNQYKKQQT